MQQCYDTCTTGPVSPECRAEWIDHNSIFHQESCDDYYDYADNDVDPDYDDDDDCTETCNESYACPDSPFEDCTMTECFNSCDAAGEVRCWAGWYDFEGNWREADCDEYYAEVECLDYDTSVDDCVFEECSEDGNCWMEVCNKDSEEFCAEYSCQVWKYSEADDYWSVEECPKDMWDFTHHFKKFAEIYNETFRDAFNHTCPMGECFDNFTAANFEIFDTHNETIDAFLSDDTATDIAHDAVDRTADALQELGYETELDWMHGLLE